MDDRYVGDQGGVVGEHVGTVTSYEPAVRAATVRLRAPVRTGTPVRIASNDQEWDEPLRLPRGVWGRKRVAPSGEDVIVRLERPVEVGADIYRLWSAAA